MEFVVLHSFDNYVDAHLLMSRLESEEIDCWLKDEDTVTTMPIWTNAVGGIKLMVKKEDLVHAAEIFNETEKNRKAGTECPKCKSSNTEFVSSPQKIFTWLNFLLGLFFISYAPPAGQVHHCFNCGYEFQKPE